MNLDCIKGDGMKDEEGAWIIIDHDNDCREFVSSHSIDYAWFLAARRLEKRINDVKLILNA